LFALSPWAHAPSSATLTNSAVMRRGFVMVFLRS
jgi:hypothetical protein